MTFQCRTVLATSALLAGAACAFAQTGRVQLVRTPDSGLQPQVAQDEAGTVHLVYLAGDPAGCDVFYRRRSSGQTNFSTAIKVNSDAGTAIALGTVRGAQIAVASGRVYIAWNGSAKAKAAHHSDSAMLFSRLNPSGTSKVFEPERNLITHTRNLDGGGSVAADRSGNVYVVWHAHEAGEPDEDESHRGVYIARSEDFGQTFAPEVRVKDLPAGTCGCCGLAACSLQERQLAILYRSADSAGNRDMVLLLSTNYGASFAHKVLGKWKVSTCPMSTPALGSGPNGKLVAMWETDGQVFRALIDPWYPNEASVVAAQGRPSQRKHPRFACSALDGSPCVWTWVEGTGWDKGGELAWQSFSAAGSGPLVGRSKGVPPWTFSAVVPDGDGGFTILY